MEEKKFNEIKGRQEYKLDKFLPWFVNFSLVIKMIGGGIAIFLGSILIIISFQSSKFFLLFGSMLILTGLLSIIYSIYVKKRLNNTF
jgi:hypothetical protein